jgi:hypothetical protein
MTTYARAHHTSAPTLDSETPSYLDKLIPNMNETTIEDLM